MRRIVPTLALLLACTGCTAKRTPPAQIMNTGADIPLASLPNNPLAWRVVTSGANRTQKIMYTLYADDNAIGRARSSGDYPPGSQIALVTWTQKEDPHWFGGSIPGQPVSVEYLSFSASTPKYTRFIGHPLTQDTAPVDPARILYITSMKPALMP